MYLGLQPSALPSKLESREPCWEGTAARPRWNARSNLAEHHPSPRTDSNRRPAAYKAAALAGLSYKGKWAHAVYRPHGPMDYSVCPAPCG